MATTKNTPKPEDASTTTSTDVGTAAPATTTETPKTPDTTADQPTKEEVAAKDAEGEQKEVPVENPNKPAEILDETKSEEHDRHVAATELPVGEVTDPSTQADTAPAEDAKTLLVAGAASGPDVAGVIRNDEGRVAYAPPGTYNAAMAGVQQDASGHVSSVGTDNTSASGTRA